MFRVYTSIYRNLRARTTVNGVSSETIHLMRGILQGGESSPVLFNIMINDIITELKKLDIGFKIYSKNLDDCDISSKDDDFYYIFIVCLM